MLISIQNLTKSYALGNTDIPVLHGINLEIEKNEYVAIMGPSGSGKSTLMNIFGLLDNPTTGEYLFNGINVNELDDDSLSGMRNKEIGFIFQNFNLLPRINALLNIELPFVCAGASKIEIEERVDELLKYVELEDKKHSYPSQLSGGQKQRVAIARALVTNPGILLADEPTGALDTKTGVDIMRLFDELHKEGNTIILITHEQEIAEYANRIIHIRDGIIHSDEANNNKRNF